jgi:hypothetical protein
MASSGGGRRRGTPTQKGFEAVRGASQLAEPPLTEERTEVDIPLPPSGSRGATGSVDLPPAQEASPLHVEVERVAGSPSLIDSEWRAVEIWTRNRIYVLNQGLVCIDVVDQATRRSTKDHPFIGGRLVGGQRRENGVNELSHPFPVPGSEAVFERHAPKRARLAQTSTVIRVVVRMRIITLTGENVERAWEDITGGHRVP